MTRTHTFQQLSKERGYSINNEEYVKGLTCNGAPVINYNTNKVKGAVSLDFPAADYSLEIVENKYTGILTKLASELSEISYYVRKEKVD
jgi:IclR family pca regulon transcriptional regulator